jgi:ribosome-associated translation inhibitor RaiA
MTTRAAIPTHIRTRWLDYSPALHWHARTRVQAALRPFASRVRWIHVRITPGEGPRGERTCDIEAMLIPSGWLTASGTAADAYRAVDEAVRKIRGLLRREVPRRRDVDALRRIA